MTTTGSRSCSSVAVRRPTTSGCPIGDVTAHGTLFAELQWVEGDTFVQDHPENRVLKPPVASA